MTIVYTKLSFAVFIWMITLIGGYFAFYLQKHKEHIHHSVVQLAEAFAGGIFLGVALFHMLPDADIALHKFNPALDYPFANLICAGGFCLFLFLEQAIHHINEHEDSSAPNVIPFLFIILISFHALSEGIALGVNQALADIVVIFLAIIAHKASEAFATGMQLMKGTLNSKMLLSLFLAFSLMSPLGVGLGIFMMQITGQHYSQFLIGFFNALAAGTFLYIATLHRLHHQHQHKLGYLYEFYATLAGLLLMAVVAIWI